MTNQKMGWKTPAGTLPWSPEVSLKAMDASGIDIAILSLPALFTGEVSEENRKIARDRNIAMSSIVNAHPTRFAFLGCVPFLDDVDGVLQEIAYSLDVLQAVGISMSSSYGDEYVGDDRYDAVWAELNRRKAVVFLHGTQMASRTPDPHPFLYSLSVVIDVQLLSPHKVPNETFKAAAHLVVTGRKRQYPFIKIVLAHLGGTTPILAPRVAVLANHQGCSLTYEEILEDFGSFYYETALSSYGPGLTCMDAFVSLDQILFGTDFPGEK
ncbi:hypothetical protein H0H87_009665 [Tephrocybe sp. NHM501043]|nr:hypothetical protein H0H87_009665 [Tephrocybe sp. NHM501043]